MAYLVNLKTFNDTRGSLTVVENILPFDIKRVFYIYGMGDNSRGGHSHRCSVEAIVCINGSCVVYIDDGENEEVFDLNSPDVCLIIQPRDWREMFNFTEDAVLLAFSSVNYNEKDYIHEHKDR